MKAVMLLLCLSIAAVSYGQTNEEAEYQEYLKQSREHLVKRQKMLNNQLGRHWGFEYSVNSMPGFNGGTKNGVHAFYGNRLSENWMLAGIAGIDILSPKDVEYIPLVIVAPSVKYTRPILSIPVMGEARFYFGASHFMPYLFTQLGASISKYPGVIFSTGAGSDINFRDSKTIFISLGLGANSAPGVEDSEDNDEQKMSTISLFTVNFRIGFYF